MLVIASRYSKRCSNRAWRVVVCLPLLEGETSEGTETKTTGRECSRNTSRRASSPLSSMEHTDPRPDYLITSHEPRATCHERAHSLFIPLGNSCPYLQSSQWNSFRVEGQSRPSKCAPHCRGSRHFFRDTGYPQTTVEYTPFQQPENLLIPASVLN